MQQEAGQVPSRIGLRAVEDHEKHEPHGRSVQPTQQQHHIAAAQPQQTTQGADSTYHDSAAVEDWRAAEGKIAQERFAEWASKTGGRAKR
jgi:hypothetical protein